MSYPSKKLEEVCKITMGQAPEGDSYNTDNEGLALIAGAGDFGEKFPKPKKYTTKPSKKSEKGEIILCIRATIGDVNISDKEYCLGRGVAGLVADEKELNQFYLWHWLKFSANYLKSKGKGATFLQVTKQDIASLEIPLPPLSEQKRIAEILDKADELRQKRQQSIEKLDELLQATFIDMFGDPLTNQKNWEISKLVNEIELIQIGPFGTQLHQEDYVENSIPLINPSHIRNGKIFPDNKLTVSEEKYHQLPQYHMKTNDVIVGRRGEMGRCAVVTERENGYFCGTGSLFLRMNEKNLNATFLSFILSSNSIKKLLENSSQGVTMANLNKKIVSEIPLIMPNIDLQSKFGEFVDSINLQKQRLKVQSKQQENLFQSLQQRAFNGEL